MSALAWVNFLTWSFWILLFADTVLIAYLVFDMIKNWRRRK